MFARHEQIIQLCTIQEGEASTPIHIVNQCLFTEFNLLTLRHFGARPQKLKLKCPRCWGVSSRIEDADKVTVTKGSVCYCCAGAVGSVGITQEQRDGTSSVV